MSQVSDAIDQLYTHFVLRDILAKAIPGLLTILTILAVSSKPEAPIRHIRLFASEWVVAVVVYGLSFLAGLALQYVASKLRFIRIHVWPSEAGRSSSEVSLRNAQSFIEKAGPNHTLLRARERYAVLKEMTASYAALSLLAAAGTLIAPLTRRFQPTSEWGLLLLVLALLIWLFASQNRFHANEQRIWEDALIRVTKASTEVRQSARKKAVGPKRGSKRTRR